MRRARAFDEPPFLYLDAAVNHSLDSHGSCDLDHGNLLAGLLVANSVHQPGSVHREKAALVNVEA